ncbi:MAG: ornithine cyclodeaminase family protein [Candidatus Eiseniibacteriota bacterium]
MTRILSDADVRRLLPLRECLDVMEEALKTLSRGDALHPLRSLLRIPDGSGLLGLMPAYLGTPPCIGIKVVTVMPGNHGTPWDAHQGAVLLFEAEHGRLLAVIDASSVTAMRTAAVSGVATRVLARKDAGRVAILGSGVQAASHLEAMLAARDVTTVTVWSRNGANARRFAERESARPGFVIRVAATAREAVEGAEIVCTTTSSREPVLEGAWLSPGTHVNAAGACFPAARELDTAAVVRARLFVDRRESALNEAGDFLIPKKEGAVGDDHIVAELGDLLLGSSPGRRSDDEVTLFKSLGLGVEDLAAAHFLHGRAEAEDSGASCDLGGRRES